MDDVRALLERTASIAADYLESLGDRRVFPDVTPEELRAALGGPLPEQPIDPETVVTDLAEAAEPGVLATGTGRYFGFVIGGALPAALAADWLTSAWDQNAGLYVGGPSASIVEQITREWILDLLGLPGEGSIGFVTGTQMAHATGRAAARFHVLDAVGWDVERHGLQGAPQVRVFAGAKRHVTIDRALRLLGLGCPTVVEADEEGRMRADALSRALAEGSGPTIVCAQAGEVNTGAFDPLAEIAEACRDAHAWLHVDGAFGIWAAVSPRLRHLVAGLELADSWACDGHKWLNVPYDAGYVFCADANVHATAMAYTASYLTGQVAGRTFGGGDFVPESSRRARGFATWAAIRSLGRTGIADLVDRCTRLARRFAERLDALEGVEVVNDVVLNQVLVRVGDGEFTDLVERRVQEDGTCWLGATTWRGERFLRISVSNWSTTEADVDLSVDAIAKARAAVLAARTGRRAS
jgi:glutamate/tyrosine decarboxylase-like PLP-dependent enzyme